jgi:type VI secretion system protein ImpH
MGAEDRTAAHPLIGRLYEQPYAYSFFMAVRRLENAYPDRPRTGHSRGPADDPIRFCQEPTLAFPPATLRKLEFGKDGRSPRLYVAFMGVFGPNGPMPLQFTAYAHEREMAKDTTLARFIDVFHHRMVSLFYRAWACSQQAVQFERGEGDRFSVYVGSLFGMGMPSLRNRDAIPDVAKLHYSGRLACQTRHAEGLQAILEDYFRITARVEEFAGQWLELPPENQCRLGETPRTGSLGHTAICGSRIWDCQQKFRLRFGAMGLADYERMLPGGRSLVRLAAWVRNYTADELSWDLQLVLKKEEVPKTHMGTYGRLGWTTWLQSQPFDRDADDLVLRPSAA